MFSSRYDLISLKAGRNSRPEFYPHGENSIKSFPMNNTQKNSIKNFPMSNTQQTSIKNFPVKTSQVLVFHLSTEWKAHFEASKSTNKLMVIEFTASWCKPCRYMGPIMKDFATKYTDVEFIKMDVHELMGMSSTFGVQTLPTMILIKKGNLVDKITGVKKEDLQKKIEKNRAYSCYSYQNWLFISIWWLDHHRQIAAK